MMFVKTKVKSSRIAGLGLFADQPIKKGVVVWKFTPGFDLKFTQAQVKKFPKQVREFLKVYSWFSQKSKKYCFSSDNGRYFNHSSRPNCLSAYVEGEEEVVTRAVRNIKKGEEMTDDYTTFESGFKGKF